MPAYSFQERFVPFVKDGSKDRTIRKRRAKGFAKKGDTLYLYYGLRTKHCKKIREEICTSVKSIFIEANGNVVILPFRLADEAIERNNGELVIDVSAIEMHHYKLTALQKDVLAWNDGFRPLGASRKHPDGCFDLMMRFWKQTHQLPFIGDIIYWNPDK